MSDWAIRLTAQNANYAGQLRDYEHVQALQVEDAIWLRGPGGDDVGERVATLPGERFDVLGDGQLRLFGNRVPSARLPEGDWEPIRQFIRVVLPTAKYATAALDRVPLLLERGSAGDQDVDAMLVDRQSWLSYVDTAPQIRLAPLRFAAAEDGRVLVLGTPLPPVLGQRLTGASHGVIVPAGVSWVPAVEPAVVRRVFAGDLDALVLWLESDRWEFVAADSVLSVSRSAVRATLSKSGGAL